MKLKTSGLNQKKTGYDFRKECYKDTPSNAEIERLLAKLDTVRDGKDKQSVLITSAVQGEGKSTASTLIALASSRDKKNPTLLVDFDLRRSRLYQHFGVNREGGVIDILSNRLPFKLCVKKTHFDNLKILTSGNLHSSPIGALNSESIKRFFNEAFHYFDNIIVDCPPIIPVSDPLVLSKFVDNVILVVKAGSTSKQVVKRAIDMIYSIEVDVCGIILNNMNNVLPYYYDTKHYRYHYYNDDNQDQSTVLG